MLSNTSIQDLCSVLLCHSLRSPFIEYFFTGSDELAYLCAIPNRKLHIIICILTGIIICRLLEKSFDFSTKAIWEYDITHFVCTTVNIFLSLSQWKKRSQVTALQKDDMNLAETWVDKHSRISWIILASPMKWRGRPLRIFIVFFSVSIFFWNQYYAKGLCWWFLRSAQYGDKIWLRKMSSIKKNFAAATFTRQPLITQNPELKHKKPSLINVVSTDGPYWYSLKSLCPIIFFSFSLPLYTSCKHRRKTGRKKLCFMTTYHLPPKKDTIKNEIPYQMVAWK